MNKIIISTALAVLGLCSHSAMAYECITLTPSTTLSPRDLTVSSDLPVGAVIGTEMVTPIIYAYSCANTDSGNIGMQAFGIKAIGTYDTMLNGQRVYKTNVAGVGYSISGKTSQCAGGSATVNGSGGIDGGVNTAKFCDKFGIISPTLTGSLIVTYYKTAAEVGSGTVVGGPVGSLVVVNNYSYWQTPEATLSVNGFRVNPPSCKLTTTSIPVNLKDVDKKFFNGKGSTPGDAFTQSFNLPLKCSVGTNVSVKMEGDIYDATQGVINTTRGNNAATGVGIQLLYNNYPVILGSSFTVDHYSDVSVNVPYKARYYQTGDRITPGTANGMVSLTMTYE